jgi:hypothetical protein
MPFALARTGMATALHRAVPGALHLASAAPGHGLRHMPVARLALEQTDSARIGFRGLMLQAWSEKHNSFLRPLKQKGFKEERVTTIELSDIGKSHDPGIQQEPKESVFYPYYTVEHMRGRVKKETKKAILQQIVEPQWDQLSPSQQESIRSLLEEIER